MNCFRYKLDHDYGLAPNPFWGFMSLAVCKGPIRKNRNLQIGDWIVGFGSKNLGNLNKLIYAMKVEKIITFDEYWDNESYECKKPIINGSLAQMYGDNFYHTTAKGVVQEKSAHCLKDLTTNNKHLLRDAGGKNVLLSKHFFYFGDKCVDIPQDLNKIYCESRGYCYRNICDNLVNKFIEWLETNYKVGIYGDPINWKNFNLPKMEIYEDV